MSAARTVHVVVPDGIADPLRPSGGNTYDVRLCGALVEAGWTVDTRAVTGEWPWPRELGRRALCTALEGLPDGALVLVDGLVASGVPEAWVPAARRLRLVVLLHMPLGAHGGCGRSERAVLDAATAVVTTSGWTREWLLAAYDLDPTLVHVARPGVDAAPEARPSPEGTRLLCVGAVLPAKGHDVLVEALAAVSDLAWRCVCVGSLTRDAAFVEGLRARIAVTGLGDRLVLAGPLTGETLERSYAAADLLVHASRAESYGMVVTEALAHGLPVVATDAGGVAEALGVTAEGRRPGMLVPPDDPPVLAEALRRWLTGADTRSDLRRAALRRREALTGWPETAARVARVLEAVAA